MKRFSTILTLAAVAAVCLTLPAAAQDRPPVGMADRLERHGGGLLRCLRGLGLSAGQKADINAILDAAKPTFEADVQAIRAAHQKLDADYDAGADKSILGQDYIDVRAAAKKLHDDRQATKDQVLGKLTADQKTRAQACLDASHPRMGARMSD
jgi:hypothetical protein